MPWYDVYNGDTSTIVNKGDVVCSTPSPGQVRTANTSNLTGGHIVIGVAQNTASAGEAVSVVEAGLIAAALTGLSSSTTGGLVYLDSKGRCSATASTTVIGRRDSQGNMTFTPQTALDTTGLKTLEDNITALGTRASKLEGDTSTLGSKLTSTDGGVQTLTTRLNTLQAQVDKLPTSSGGSVDLVPLTTRVSTLETDRSAHATRLDKAETSLSTQAGQIKSAETAISTLQGTVQQLSTTVGELKTSVQSMLTDVRDLKAAVAALKTSGGTGTTSDGGTTTTVTRWSALKLTGVTSVITLPKVAALKLQRDLTLEIWLRPDRLADEQAIIMSDADCYGMLQLSTGSTQNTTTVGASVRSNLNFFYGHEGGPRTTVTVSYTFTVGTWVHIAVVRDCSVSTSQTVRIYVNGQRLHAAQVTDTRAVAADPYYAWRVSSYQPLLGAVADFRLWNVPRSSAEIAENFKKRLTGKETGLVGYYKMDETGTPTTIAHISDRTYDASAVGVSSIAEGPTVSGTDATTASKYEPALRFNGTIPSTATLAANNGSIGYTNGSLTMELWIRVDSVVTGYGYMLTKYTYYEFGVRLTPGSSTGKFNLVYEGTGVGEDNGRSFSAVDAIKGGVWTHIAAVRDVPAATVRLYVNGAKVAEKTSCPPVQGVGSWWPWKAGWQIKADIAHMRFWKVARTDAEIAANYNKRLTGASGVETLWEASASGPRYVASTSTGLKPDWDLVPADLTQTLLVLDGPELT